MPDHVPLLPGAAPPWARMMARLNDPLSTLWDKFSDVRSSQRITPPQMIPYLIWQYGLGELTPYVPSLYQLIDEGVRWNRIRGTPAAITKGLSWIGYAGTLREHPVRRVRWNLFDYELSRIRDNDRPDLERIDGIISLSPPVRSQFWRGFRGYDVPAAETSYTRTGGSIVGDDSGVRIDNVPAKWSFGRDWQREVTLTQAELTSLGAWIPTVPTGDLWVDANYFWSTANFLWAQPAAVARRNSIAQPLIAQTPVWVRFRSADGGVIGNTRAVAWRVKLDPAGQYQFGTSRYKVTTTEVEGMIVAARTGFGDGAGKTAASMSVVFGGQTPAGKPTGSLWLEPTTERLSSETIPSATMSRLRTGLLGGTEVATTAVTIPFGLTVRERPMFLLRF